MSGYELHQFCREISARPPMSPEKVDALDPGIAGAVVVLHDHGIETCQSCEGGAGHAYPCPTVDFLGGAGQGYAAVSVAVQHGLRPSRLSRVWNIDAGEIYESVWRIEFARQFQPGTYEAAS
jgi:hypothetical protein